MAMVTVEVTTLAGAKHSGQFGGAAPDALLVAAARAGARCTTRRATSRWPGCAARSGQGESYSDDEFRALAEVARRAAADRHRRPRLARVVGAGDHGHRHRRAVGRERGQRGVARRAGQAQPARPPRAGRRRGAGGARRPPAGVAPVRDRAARSSAARPATASRRRPAARPTTPRARRWSGRVGHRAVDRGRRRVDPAGQRAARRGPGRRDPAASATTDGYANIHAPDERVLVDELEKAVAVEAAFFGEFAERWARAGDALSAPGAAHADAALLDGIERLGQQDARPGDHVPVAVRGRDRALAGARAGSTSRRRTRSSSRRRAAIEETVLRRLHRTQLRRADTSRAAGRRYQVRHEDRPRSRACSPATACASCSRRSSTTSATSRRSRSSSW